MKKQQHYHIAKQTFVPLVSAFALRTRLLTIFSLVLIAWSANRKCANITGNKWFTLDGLPNMVSTYLTGTGAHVLYNLSLSLNEHHKTNG